MLFLSPIVAHLFINYPIKPRPGEAFDNMRRRTSWKKCLTNLNCLITWCKQPKTLERHGHFSFWINLCRIWNFQGHRKNIMVWERKSSFGFDTVQRDTRTRFPLQIKSSLLCSKFFYSLENFATQNKAQMTMNLLQIKTVLKLNLASILEVQN